MQRHDENAKSQHAVERVAFSVLIRGTIVIRISKQGEIMVIVPGNRKLQKTKQLTFSDFSKNYVKNL
jgi:hypothetical protein